MNSRFIIRFGLVLWLGALLPLNQISLAPLHAAARTQTILPPPAGKLYHAVYPGGQTGEEDDLTRADLQSYEQTVGKTAAWVYFSNNWYRSRAFPLETATWIRDSGAVPFIRLMLRDRPEQNQRNRIFTLRKILRGRFDGDLRAWARAARDFGSPLLVEYGTEVNGEWFPWNGKWNGRGKKDGYGDPNYPDGPERFRDAYRHIIDVMRAAGADNLTWVFHVNADDWPARRWNRFENYYPGDAYIDWIGVSAYGAQTPLDDWCDEFSDMIDQAYPRLDRLAPAKPIVVLEFGVTAGNPLCDQAAWAENALTALTQPRWARVIGFSWWNEKWQNDDDPAHDTNMRVQDNPELAAVFQQWVGANDDVLGRLITNTPPLIYHGVTTHSWSTLWGLTGQADAIKAEVDAYEAAAGRTVAWVGFAHEWQTDGRAFPSEVAISIRNRSATPLIFLNLRSTDEAPDPLYNLNAIISGQFDSDFAAWADGAKSFGSELIVDWGWEMNGDWNPWNGIHNGGPTKGPQRYREAYRHIIELMRNRGATNIRWAFHINFPESPDESWNAFENYYPGDDVIDIIGASIYSAQTPTDDFFPSFESLMDPAYSRLTQMAPEKPVFVFEFGAAAGNPLGSSVTWADDALAGILSGRWPAIRSFAWWNDYWQNDSNPAHDTEMRVEVVPGLATVFKSRLSGAGNLGDRPPIFSEPSPLRTLAEQRGGLVSTQNQP